MTIPVDQTKMNTVQNVLPVKRTGTSASGIILLCILSILTGAFGYRTYDRLTRSDKQDSVPIQGDAPSSSPRSEFVQPSPSPIVLHAGIGDYSVSHPKTGGPTISRVVFDPLDAKKGQTIKLSAIISSQTDDVSVTGGLTTDTQQIDLTFTKAGTNNNMQIWSTEFILPDNVLYRYIFAVTATNSQGKTVVRVSPRS